MEGTGVRFDLRCDLRCGRAVPCAGAVDHRRGERVPLRVRFATIMGKADHMTITLRPEQEQVIQEAIQSGMYGSVDEVLDRALESIRTVSGSTLSRSQLAGRRIRKLRKGVTLGGTPIKELIEEGRE